MVRLCLTAEGHEALARADAAYGRWLDQMLAETSEPDLVLHALDVINQAMDELRYANSAALTRRPASAGPVSELEGRGTAWPEERETSDEGRR